MEDKNQEEVVIESKALYKDDQHGFYWLGLESTQDRRNIHVNQYLIVHKGRGIVLDAGGVSAFPRVLHHGTQYCDLDEIELLWYSHQDPDCVGGIGLWMDLCAADVMIGSYWTEFIGHMGIEDMTRIKPIPDEGMKFQYSDTDYLEFIPAHFLHSTCNYHLYDSRSKILYSVDVGAMGDMQDHEAGKKVKDVKPYLERMAPFHKRFMASNSAARAWVNRISKYDIEIMAPQHGPLLSRSALPDFYEWFSKLKCGVDLLYTEEVVR